MYTLKEVMACLSTTYMYINKRKEWQENRCPASFVDEMKYIIQSSTSVIAHMLTYHFKTSDSFEQHMFIFNLCNKLREYKGTIHNKRLYLFLYKHWNPINLSKYKDNLQKIHKITEHFVTLNYDYLVDE